MSIAERLQNKHPSSLTDIPIMLIRARNQTLRGNYRNARQMYDVVIRESRWPRYRIQAQTGLADTAAYEGDYAAAIQALGEVISGNPDAKDIPRWSSLIENLKIRRDRLVQADAQDVNAVGQPASQALRISQACETVTFSPSDPWLEQPQGYIKPRPTMGFDDDYAALADVPTLGFNATQLPIVHFRDFPYGRPMHIEFWYREHLHPTFPDNIAALKIRIQDHSGLNTIAEKTFPLRQTFGQWRRGILELSPSTTLLDGSIHCEIIGRNGIIEIDGLRITAPTHKQQDRLRMFQAPDFLR